MSLLFVILGICECEKVSDLFSLQSPKPTSKNGDLRSQVELRAMLISFPATPPSAGRPFDDDINVVGKLPCTSAQTEENQTE